MIDVVQRYYDVYVVRSTSYISTSSGLKKLKIKHYKMLLASGSVREGAIYFFLMW
jgi:hypothetical protein